VASKDEDAQRTGPEGRYANLFEVGHNDVEFVLDFGQSYFEGDRPRFHSRIVTTPMYAKRLLAVLQEAVTQYEAAYGPVLDASEGCGKKMQ
jgi:uncharacterized protein DUF3467